jgi:hypothetical protein
MPKDPILEAQQKKQWENAKESWHNERMKQIRQDNQNMAESAKGCRAVIIIGFLLTSSSIVSVFFIYKIFT